MPPAEDPVRRLALAGVDADGLIDELMRGVGDRRLAPSTIYAYIGDPAFERGAEVTARLGNDAQARETMRRMAMVGGHYAPRLAAASTGLVNERRVGGILIRLIPSQRNPAQIFVSFEIAEPNTASPAVMAVIGEDGGCLREVLPPFSGGVAQTIYEDGSPLVLALSDPASEIFLR